MSNLRHTQGPWRKLGNVVVAIIDGREVVLAHSDGMFLDSNEREANTHLIAAAPDLLAACENALPRLIELSRYRSDREGTSHAQDFNHAIDLLRVAIAKTKGVQS